MKKNIQALREAPTGPPPGLRDHEQDAPAEAEGPKKKKTSKNKSARKKLIKVFEATEEAESQAKEIELAANEVLVNDAGVQTEVSLPHTHRDVMWTPSSMDPIFEVCDDAELEREATDTVEKLEMGVGVECVDNVDDDPECIV